MKQQVKSFNTIYFTYPIIALMAFCSVMGIFNSSVYGKETTDWLSQCLGQDFSNLFCVIPLLLFSAYFSLKESRTGKIIWLGAMLTNIYSYIIYCFSIHFNFLFHFYCLILGLSLYAVIGFTLQNFNMDFKSWFSNSIKRTSYSAFLLIIGIMFSMLWFSETIPASLNNSIPSSIIKDGLPTNPVFVLDFSFYIPLIFLGAILLLRNINAGYALVPAMLVFAIITNINIISLTLVATSRLHKNNTPMIISFFIFTVTCIIVLLLFLRNIKAPGKGE